jgi:hypothetical protein
MATLFGATLLVSGCDRTDLATSDTACNGRIGFSPCADEGGGDAGLPPPLVPDAPEPGTPPGACTAQFGFEDGTVQGFEASSCCGIDVGALQNVADRAWCGRRSLGLSFESRGANLMLGGPRISAALAQPVDLSGMTVFARVYVDGPVGGRLYGLAAAGALASLIANPVRGLPTGRWSELAITFGDVLPVTATEVGIEIVGADFAGTTRIYLDDVGWQ